MNSNQAKRVAIARTSPRYPVRPPYSPDFPFPEYPFRDHISSEYNGVYRAVRDLLLDLNLDTEHYGTAEWNPLGTLIPPNAVVVVKPNWVMHENEGPGGTDCLVTHPSVLRAVLDYLFLARPSLVVLGDAPIQGCNWDALMSLGFADVLRFEQAQGLPVVCRDFRRTIFTTSTGQKPNRTTEDNFVEVDLSYDSLLEPISNQSSKFRVTMYDPRKMAHKHAPGRHRYLVARDVLRADLVVNVPKVKTHKKAGITGALKNLVGINGSKEYLPHHRKGPLTLGGDNYEKFSFFRFVAEQIVDFSNMFFLHKPAMYKIFSSAVRLLLRSDISCGGDGNIEGSWYGNDTVWRMCLDLNRLLFYADLEGKLQDQPIRLELTIADGIVAGQGEGPLCPDPLDLGVMLASLNPAALDWVAATLMFIDPRKVPIIYHAFDQFRWKLCFFDPREIECVTNAEVVPHLEAALRFGKPARPPNGWRGHCELQLQS